MEEEKDFRGMVVSKDRLKEKLKDFVDDEITSLFGSILDFTEVAVGDKERYRALRAKILRLGNDTIRSISKEIDERYVIQKYLPPSEDIIVVRSQNIKK
jgi:asparagine synthetase A